MNRPETKWEPEVIVIHGDEAECLLRAPGAAEFTGAVAVLGARLAGGSTTITRLPSDHSNEELARLLGAIAASLGVVAEQDSAGSTIVEVRDRTGDSPGSLRGYQDAKPMLLHSDPTDVVGLLCLARSSHGGTSLLRRSESVLEQLAAQEASLDIYLQPWRWATPASGPAPSGDAVRAPIFSRAGRVTCQYGSSLLRAGVEQDRLGADRVVALDAFDRAANDPRLVTRVQLDRGDCIWVHNFTTLHGREGFWDGPGGQGRHLLRTWVWLRERRLDQSAFRPLMTAYGYDDDP